MNSVQNARPSARERPSASEDAQARREPSVWQRSIVSRAGLLPALLFLLVLFYFPILDVLRLSVQGDAGLTLDHFVSVFTDRSTRVIFATTGKIALLTTVLCLVCAFPVAFVMAYSRRWIRNALLVAVMLPFMTSLLVRTYAWILVLSPSGVLSRSLDALGLPRLEILYTLNSVLIGTTYVLLPYMVLTLYSVMRSIPGQLMQAAAGLGASGWEVFRRVLFPLCYPGVAGGCVMVFVMSLGYFITPELLGGARQVMVGSAIQMEIQQTLDWNRASALSIVLLVATLLTIGLYERLFGFASILENRP